MQACCLWHQITLAQFNGNSITKQNIFVARDIFQFFFAAFIMTRKFSCERNFYDVHCSENVLKIYLKFLNEIFERNKKFFVLKIEKH